MCSNIVIAMQIFSSPPLVQELTRNSKIPVDFLCVLVLSSFSLISCSVPYSLVFERIRYTFAVVSYCIMQFLLQVLGTSVTKISKSAKDGYIDDFCESVRRFAGAVSRIIIIIPQVCLVCICAINLFCNPILAKRTLTTSGCTKMTIVLQLQ